MNDAQAKSWMRKLASEAPPLEPPAFEAISARLRLEAAIERRAKTDNQLAWIDAAWQSVALSAIAILSIWLGS
jgi:hypothetical protein